MDYCPHQAALPAPMAMVHGLYCQWCMAWRVHARITIQTAEGLILQPWAVDTACGPFDGVPELAALGGDLWHRAMTCPGVPWDRGGRTTDPRARLEP